MRVKDLMSKDVITVSPKASIRAAARIMDEHGIGCLVVMQGKEVSGILTVRDVIKVLADHRAKDLDKVPVGYAMEEHVASVAPDSDICTAIEMMEEGRVMKLPVVEKGKLVGIVTSADIVECYPGIKAKCKKKK